MPTAGMVTEPKQRYKVLIVAVALFVMAGWVAWWSRKPKSQADDAGLMRDLVDSGNCKELYSHLWPEDIELNNLSEARFCTLMSEVILPNRNKMKSYAIRVENQGYAHQGLAWTVYRSKSGEEIWGGFMCLRRDGKTYVTLRELLVTPWATQYAIETGEPAGGTSSALGIRQGYYANSGVLGKLGIVGYMFVDPSGSQVAHYFRGDHKAPPVMPATR